MKLGRRYSSYWLVVAFVGLMLTPAPWALSVLLAGALCRTALGIVRVVRARRLRLAASGASSEGVILGSDRTGKRVLLDDPQLSAHGLILGASGAGKSTTMLRILTGHVRRGLPVVAIDMKGSPAFAGELARAAAEAGRPIAVWTPDGPSRWNPLQYGNATELKDKLIATERFTEPHYQRAAERYLQTTLQVLQHAHPERAPTLEEVVNVMDPARMSRALRGLPRPILERVQDYLATLTPDQLSAIRGLQTRLALITESHTGEFLSPPSSPAADREQIIDLREALTGGAVVLFSLNSSTYGRLAAQIGTLVVQDLVSAVGHRLTPRPEDVRQAVVGIDEFSALGADHVMALLARGREAGVGTLLATQELADLDRAAPGLRDQVLGNTAIKIAHRQDVPSSAHTIAQMAGTEKVWEETRQIGGSLLGSYATGRGTRRQVEQFVIHPDRIKSLRTGDAVVISKLPGMRARTVRVSPVQRSEGREPPRPEGREPPRPEGREP